MSSWSVHAAVKKRKLDQKGWLQMCAELGLDGVELLDIHFPSTKREYLEEIKSRCANIGLEISCVSVSNDFGLPIKRARESSEDKVREWLGHAAFFGAPVMRVFAGWPGMNARFLYKREKKRLWGEMCRRLSRLAKEGAAAGTTLAIENHNHGGFTRTSDDLFKILDAAPDLEICLDTGDYIVDTGDINGYNAIKRAAPHAAHVHAKLYGLDEKGRDPSQDWSRILDILADAGYDGALSIEYEGRENPLKAIPRGARYLMELLDKKGLREKS